MKVHITLVSGQRMPVYNGILYSQPDKVIFIASQQSKSDITFIQKEFENTNISFTTEILDPVDIKQTADTALALSEKYKDDQISVNITGGTKIWSCYFSIVFYNVMNASVFYIDQNNRVLDFVHPEKNAAVPFDMFILFRLNGNPLTKYTKFTQYTAEDIEAIKQIEEIRNVNLDIFKQLTMLDRGKQNTLEANNKGSFQISSQNSSVSWNKKLNTVHFVIRSKKSEIDETLSSPNIIKLAFNFNWFEVKCADILSKWDKVKPENIYLNCIFPNLSQHNQNDTDFPKNEVDIIINTGDKPLFVECKTQITESTDIDKFSTVIHNYGGIGSKGLFLTEYHKNSMMINKIKESNLIEFSLLDKITNSKKKIYKPTKDLYELLDKHLYQINKK